MHKTITIVYDTATDRFIVEVFSWVGQGKRKIQKKNFKNIHKLEEFIMKGYKGGKGKT